MSPRLSMIIPMVGLLATLSTEARAQSWTEYDAASGLLPEETDWTLLDNTPSQPDPTVSGGVLHQGPTGSGCRNNNQTWYRSDVPIDLTDTFALELELQVIRSNYVSGAPCGDFGCGGQPSWKPGYYVGAIDQNDRKIFMGITSDGLLVDPGCCFCPTEAPLLPFDTTDDFHLYRLEVEGGIVRLFVDGTLFHSVPLGSILVPGFENRVGFADGSHQGSSETLLKWIRYTNDLPGTRYCFGDGTGAPCPCSNPGGTGEGCANSSSLGGLLSASGSTSVAADDLRLHASDLLPGQPALLFAGEDAVGGGDGATFGDGLRCAGTGVRRLGIHTPGADGSATFGPMLGVAGGWNAGDLRRFQVWYRDPAGPCGSGFNLTNGVEVSFAP